MNKQIKYIFRLVHILNIPHILKYGIVSSSSPNKSEKYVPIGDDSLIVTRKDQLIPDTTNRIGDFIPFYFGTKTPMLFTIQNGYNNVKKQKPEDIVYCVVRIDDIIEKGLTGYFTDGHARSANTQFNLKAVWSMIEYVTGNIFDSEAEALVNTVNTQGVMGKGLALQFKERYPNNFSLYKRACKNQEVRVGKMFISKEIELSGLVRTIVNFPTKKQWRLPSEYIYIEEGLKELKKEIVSRQIKSIAIPPLGSSNGGLDWNVVKPMIETELKDVECSISIYEPCSVIVERMRKEKIQLTPARAMLISVLSDMIAEDGTPSEFAAEKIAFFLQLFGAKKQFNLSFARGYYGPYSGKVRHVLHHLNGSYIMGMGSLSNKPFDELWLTADAAEVANQYLSLPDNQEYNVIAEKVKTFLRGYYSNYMLELLATIAFLKVNGTHLANVAMEKQIEIIGQNLALWSNRKERLFHKTNMIATALSHLDKYLKMI